MAIAHPDGTGGDDQIGTGHFPALFVDPRLPLDPLEGLVGVRGAVIRLWMRGPVDRRFSQELGQVGQTVVAVQLAVGVLPEQTDPGCFRHGTSGQSSEVMLVLLIHDGLTWLETEETLAPEA